MGKFLVLVFLVCCSLFVSAQRLHIGVFGGLAAYNGELAEKIFPKKVTNGAIGITGNYELSDKIMIRAGYTYAIVGGADRFGTKPDNIKRNLAFETKISEFSLVAEYYLNNLYDRRYSPYVFAGLAIFHFDPYAFNGTTQKVFLKPLSTEGQGLSGYPDRKPYALMQPALPFGGGVKFAVTDNLHIGLELGIRYLFTDYLDDVSKSYIDPNDLLAAKGQLAVDMSYRGDEPPINDPNYPVKGFLRGGEDFKDLYYFTGLHLTYRISGNGGGGFGGGGRKSKLGCPTNIY